MNEYNIWGILSITQFENTYYKLSTVISLCLSFMYVWMPPAFSKINQKCPFLNSNQQYNVVNILCTQQ